MTKNRERETQAVKIARIASDVWATSAKDAKELAFMSRILVQAFLPHSDPKVLGWSRKNGDHSLSVKSGIDENENGEFVPYGVPYGTVPRLLLAWLNSEAVRNAQDTQNDKPYIINLGRSLSDFLDKLGIDRSGGKKGGITRFKKQAERLFHAEISFTYSGTYQGKKGIAKTDMKVSDGQFFFWDMENPEQTSLWNSSIKLSEAFYKLLTSTPVPLDWRILRAIKQSPMALDLYMWLTHRMSYLNKPASIGWETLKLQLGANLEEDRKFKQQVRKHLKKISTIWRDLNVDASKPDAIYLYPTQSLLFPAKKAPFLKQ